MKYYRVKPEFDGKTLYKKQRQRGYSSTYKVPNGYNLIANELLEVGKMNNSKLNELFDICFNCENEESTWCDDCPIKKKIDLLQYNERGKNHDLRKYYF